MMYPPGSGSQEYKNKLQKIFIASSPFNIIFANYLKSQGDLSLERYLNSLVIDYLKDNVLTPEMLIEQIEEEYEKYLLYLELENDSN